MQKTNNLTQRIITAVLGAAVLITGLVWNIYSLIAVMYLLSLLIHIEYLRTVQSMKGRKLNYFELTLNLLVGVFVFSIAPASISEIIYYGNIFMYLCVSFFSIFSLFFIFELFVNRDTPFKNIGLNITGIFYCVIPFMLLVLTLTFFRNEYPDSKDLSYNSHNSNYFILGYFLIIWTHDTMSYFTGRFLGRHKLFERISPKKTWEGFLGGFIFSVCAAYFISQYLLFLERKDWIIIALIISVFGTLGDLVESMLKRSVSLKDSSSILPGHGGFLDRFDATLIAAPFVWLYIACIQF